MSRALPGWAQDIVPVDMDDAAKLLGVSRRYLVDEIKAHPHYERRGVKKVFYPEHIALLREALKCQTSTPNRAREYITPLAPSTESEFDRAYALATRKPPKSNAPSSKRNSGNVVPMARRLSAHSRKQP